MDPIEILLKEVQGYLNKKHLLLAAGTLEQYANSRPKETIGESEKNMCKKVAYELFMSRNYESAEKLYKTFGLDKECLKIMIIESLREQKLKEVNGGSVHSQ